MNKRIAIGAIVALLASLAFATVASASDGFENGDYTIFVPHEAQMDFTITDGAVAADRFSDDDKIRITSGDVSIEIDADDAKIEISCLTPAEVALVTVAFNGSIFSQENLPDDWEIAFDDNTLSGDDDSTDEDALPEDDDSDSEDDDTSDDSKDAGQPDDSAELDDDSDDGDDPDFDDDSTDGDDPEDDTEDD